MVDTVSPDQDGYVQVAADGAGKKIDNAALLREPTTLGGTGETVYRQRIVLASDENPRQQVNVTGEAGRGVLQVECRQLDEVIAKLQELIELIHLVAK